MIVGDMLQTHLQMSEMLNLMDFALLNSLSMKALIFLRKCLPMLLEAVYLGLLNLVKSMEYSKCYNLDFAKDHEK